MSVQRVTWIVLDSVGIGAMPDAADFGDAGAHTLKHVAEAMGGLKLPMLESLGLGRVDAIPGLAAASRSGAFYGKMAELSKAKDTTTGHWEMAGVVTAEPFKTYPRGFPPELIGAFEKAIGRRTLGNVTASGTAILEELGAEHLKTGHPIVYTSADSVFQVAAHEEKVPVAELHRYCEIARGLCDRYRIGRVIARPFAGSPGQFVRTLHRRDYAAPPPGATVLEKLEAAGVPVVGIGKIGDIFSERGIARSYHTQSNAAGMDQLEASLREERRGLIFVNLVDFDMLYGHRRDPQGYARALVEFDGRLGELLPRLGAGDLLMITADHGCDPTFLPSTDHTREYVPLLAYAPASRGGKSLGVRSSFADSGATAAEALGVKPGFGASFLGEMEIP
ncbi:MAG TPA: phosphopentomutase [bacterium]|nr:phosphopentomutase [bacterium]